MKYELYIYINYQHYFNYLIYYFINYQQIKHFDLGSFIVLSIFDSGQLLTIDSLL